MTVEEKEEEEKEKNNNIQLQPARGKSTVPLKKTVIENADKYLVPQLQQSSARVMAITRDINVLIEAEMMPFSVVDNQRFL